MKCDLECVKKVIDCICKLPADFIAGIKHEILPK